MGAGASAVKELETVIACTFMIAEHMQKRFPDFYQVWDFEKGREQDSSSLLGDDPLFVFGQPAQHGHRLLGGGGGGSGGGGGGGSGDSSSGGSSTSGDGSSGGAGVRDAGEDRLAELGEDLELEASHIVSVGGKRVVLTSLNEANQDGWTPLHACAHAKDAAEAACYLIEEIRREGGKGGKGEGGSLNGKVR